jgi:hypothetical protein
MAVSSDRHDWWQHGNVAMRPMMGRIAALASARLQKAMDVCSQVPRIPFRTELTVCWHIKDK